MKPARAPLAAALAAVLALAGLAACSVRPVAWQPERDGGGLWYQPERDLLLYVKRQSYGDDYRATLAPASARDGGGAVWHCRPDTPGRLVCRDDPRLRLETDGTRALLSGVGPRGPFRLALTGMPVALRDQMLRRAGGGKPDPAAPAARVALVELLLSIDLPEPGALRADRARR